MSVSPASTHVAVDDVEKGGNDLEDVKGDGGAALPEVGKVDEEKPLAPPSFPDGGRRAYLTTLGGVLVLFTTFGTSNTYASFQSEWQLVRFPSSRLVLTGGDSLTTVLLAEPTKGLHAEQHRLDRLRPPLHPLPHGSPIGPTVRPGLFPLPVAHRLASVVLWHLHVEPVDRVLSAVPVILRLHGCESSTRSARGKGLTCLSRQIALGLVFSPTLSCVASYFSPKKRTVRMGFVAAGAAAGVRRPLPPPARLFSWLILGFTGRRLSHHHQPRLPSTRLCVRHSNPSVTPSISLRSKLTCLNDG